MSASKIKIHKTEADGLRYKCLCVTIKDEDNFSAKVTYSEWADGKLQEHRKDTEKSSRLVVKIVSGADLDRFNLDISAKEVDNADKNLINTSSESLIDIKPLFKITDYSDMHQELGDHPTTISGIMDYEVQIFANEKNNKETYLSPLEHSLEKVKENNARIMENIQMLNRTLNYTKKMEILEIVCPKSMRSYPCHTCGKCFVYETGLRRHYSMRHAMSDIQPRWQVVWTCIQCFQVWPHQDQALKHSSECCKSNSMDCVREIKTSSLLQCEFCEKVYTSIPRLLRHSKVHTTANNYECNACGMAFISYKSAEQHWVSCPWLKMYYSFSLPKLLLCNACDRKFRNYEQLYNHRYKVGHFMTKTHFNQGPLKSIGIMAYQCELCGQWYPSITPLKVHKSQYHPKCDIAMQCRMDKNTKESEDYYIPTENDNCMDQNEKVEQQ